MLLCNADLILYGKRNIKFNQVLDLIGKIKMSKKKIAIITIAGIFGFLAACYIGIAIYFYQVFYPNTYINGGAVSDASPEEVKQALLDSMSDYQLKVVPVDGDPVLISGESIGFYYSFDQVDALKKKEMGWAWPVKFFTRTDYTVEAVYRWDTLKLDQEIDKLPCVTQEMTAPVDASLVIDESGVHLTEAVKGNTIRKEELKKAIAETIRSRKSEIHLDEAGCYEEPRITSESPEIRKELDRVEELCKAEVTYNFHGTEEKIGRDQIWNWVRQDGEGNLYIDQASAYNYLCELAYRHDTVGSYREFWSSRGYTITVDPGTYGWGMDVDAEIGPLMDDLVNKRVVSRDPAYYMTPYPGVDPNSPDDIGNTYIEIDLSGQYMWYYINGALIASTPITSGTLNKGYGTPSGVYYVESYSRNIVLTGDDYRQPVDFWIQVYGGIGIHDSLWRSVYGGTEYLNDGSHGCINTPYDAVSTMYWNIDIGVPVIMYY